MALAEIRTYGGGTIRFRLSVEGWPYEWVTHDDMQTTVNGAQRVVGLNLDGLKLSAKADLARGTMEASGIQVKIVDVNGYATLSLGQRPTAITWLASELAAGSTSMTVGSNAGFASTGYVYCDTETIEYGAKTGTTQFTSLTRGKWNSLDQKHYIPGGSQQTFPAVTNFPLVMEGRRAYLYVYTAGESATGNGTQVWIGIVATEPRMNGAEWSFSIDPISSVLGQEIGGDLGDPVSPRGIYYPRSVILFEYKRAAGAAGVGSIGDGFTATTSDQFLFGPGFWETQEEFIEDLNTRLSTMTSGWNCTIQARPSTDGRWFLEVVHGGGNPDSLSIKWRGPPWEARFENNHFTTTPILPALPVATFTTTGPYFFMPWPSEVEGAGMVPRGEFNSNDLTVSYGYDTTYSPRTLYLGGSVSISSRTSSVLVEWPDDDVSRAYKLNYSTAADRSITLSATAYVLEEVGTDDAHYYTPSSLPKIRFGRQYNQTGAYNGIAQFLKSLEQNAANGVNLGEQPMFKSGDYNYSVWDAAVFAAPTSLCKNRSYESFAPIAIEEIIAPELQMLGYHLALDSSGALTIKRIRFASATEIGTFAITSANLLTDNGFPGYEKGAVGRFNTVVMSTGYDPIEDEYNGATITVRDVAAYGMSPAARTIRIQPKSRYRLGPVANEEAVAISRGLLSVFGQPYAYVSCDVPLTAWGLVLLGDCVTITTDHLPDSDGTRGVTGLTGIVVGMDVEPYEARIGMTILVNPNRVAGYASSAKITAVTSGGAGGTTHTVTLSSTYFASGDSAANHFEAGDYVRVYKWDSTTGSAQSGQVTSSTGNSVTFTTTAGWTAGASTWVLAFDRADQDSSANQKLYAYVASSTGRIGWDPGDDTDADVFA